MEVQTVHSMGKYMLKIYMYMAPIVMDEDNFFKGHSQESSVTERFLIKEHNDKRHYSYNLPMDLGSLFKFLVDDNKF